MYPVGTGFLDYFPDAIVEVSRVSYEGNAQHNGVGTPVRWDKTKSTDHADCLARHFLQRGTRDTDGMRHSAKLAWRALALLQTELEREARPAPDTEPNAVAQASRQTKVEGIRGLLDDAHDANLAAMARRGAAAQQGDGYREADTLIPLAPCSARCGSLVYTNPNDGLIYDQNGFRHSCGPRRSVKLFPGTGHIKGV